ncbi:MAG: response regulator [Pedobacter sp.]|nr:MAG: response regulator [Pedobacter sp.]
MGTPDICYVEDDPDYAFILQSAISEIRDELKVGIVEDGRDAIEQLKSFADGREKPKLILLDLNLPGLSGLDVLKTIKEMPFLKYIPVILFSTSDNPKDVKASYEFGANAFVTKPDGYNNLLTCLKTMHEFWFLQNRSIN